jgi:hypothetical protein
MCVKRHARALFTAQSRRRARLPSTTTVGTRRRTELGVIASVVVLVTMIPILY